MKITIFTSNQRRHQYLINLLANVSSELFVVQECRTIFPGQVPGFYNASEVMQEYFREVEKAQFNITSANSPKIHRSKYLQLLLFPNHPSKDSKIFKFKIKQVRKDYSCSLSTQVKIVEFNNPSSIGILFKDIFFEEVF